MVMSNAGFDMSEASLVEVLGPADPNQMLEPYGASPALQLRHLNELLEQLRGFLVKADLPDRIGVGDLIQYFEVRQRNPAFAQWGTTPGNLTLWLFMLVRTPGCAAGPRNT